MKVLIVDPTATMGSSLKVLLANEGYSADVINASEEAMSYCKLYDYDIIIKDFKADKDMDSYQFLHQLRSSGINTPLIMVSEQKDEKNLIELLNLGADDFVHKPFNVKELIARCRAVVRRTQGHSASAIQIGRLKIDLRRNLAEAGGQILNLTNKEYSILELLAIRKGVMISKEMFLNHLYNGMDEPEIKIVDVFICRLRKKIADATNGDNFIQTIWGRGYILHDPAEEASSNNEEVMKAG
ncbi:MAG: DNA-binding response regulator [Rickettsiales bacterium]|nr:DNA-binding response regulator [Rickettsiales bacterium]|tara:strand:- start:12746 stop:13468 length:723 start_codon:yes stop_codon:yes gene_type:complete